MLGSGVESFITHGEQDESGRGDGEVSRTQSSNMSRAKCRRDLRRPKIKTVAAISRSQGHVMILSHVYRISKPRQNLKFPTAAKPFR